MKFILTTICLLMALPAMLAAQKPGTYLKAEYEVTKSLVESNKANPISWEIKYTGILITDGKNSLYWEEPAFLAENPDGILRQPLATGGIVEFRQSKWPRQNFAYLNTDSNLVRKMYNMQSEQDNSYVQYKASALSHTWKMYEQTMNLQGMVCQKAACYGWETVWVNTEFNAMPGPAGMLNVPGLVVKAESPLYKSMTLKSFSWTELPGFRFWPQEFNGKTFLPGE